MTFSSTSSEPGTISAPTGPITVSTLKEAEYFFKQGITDILYAVGITPHQYVMKARLDRAQQMLVQTEMSLAALSEAAGFASQSHFSRAFRGWFGMAPSDFRQQERRRAD